MKMVDKQLRLTGKLISLFNIRLSEASSEEKFIKSLKRNSKIMNNIFVEKNIKGLQCEEKWISRRKNGSKMRIQIGRAHV